MKLRFGRKISNRQQPVCDRTDRHQDVFSKRFSDNRIFVYRKQMGKSFFAEIIVNNWQSK